MSLKSCIPVIPSEKIEKSLLFWRDTLGFHVSSEIKEGGQLLFCMLSNDALSFMLNLREGTSKRPSDYEGIRFYWSPENLDALEKAREKLIDQGYKVSEIVVREYGRKEFFLTDGDVFDHCFGVGEDC